MKGFLETLRAGGLYPVSFLSLHPLLNPLSISYHPLLRTGFLERMLAGFVWGCCQSRVLFRASCGLQGFVGR